MLRVDLKLHHLRLKSVLMNCMFLIFQTMSDIRMFSLSLLHMEKFKGSMLDLAEPMFVSEPLGRQKKQLKSSMVFCSRAHVLISRLNDNQPMINIQGVKIMATTGTTTAGTTTGTTTAATAMTADQLSEEKKPPPNGAIEMTETVQLNGIPSKRMKKCSAVTTLK